MKKTAALNIEIIEEREMTDAEIDAVATMLFGWWRNNFEAAANLVDQNRSRSNTIPKTKLASTSDADTLDHEEFSKEKKSTCK